MCKQMIKNNIINENEDKIIFECIKIVTTEEIIPQKDFSSIFNESKEELHEILSNWDNLSITSEGVLSAINGTLNNIVGFPHGKYTYLESRINYSIKELDSLLEKILKHLNKNPIITDEDLKFNANKNCKSLHEKKFDNKDINNYYIGKYFITDDIGIKIYTDKLKYNDHEIFYSNILRGKGWKNDKNNGVITIICRDNNSYDIEFEINESTKENANNLGNFISNNCYSRKLSSLKYFKRLWIR